MKTLNYASSLYYKHSGRFTFVGLLAGYITGVVSFLLLALLEILFLTEAPQAIRPDIIMVMVCFGGFAVGFVIAATLKVVRARNIRAIYIVALITSLFGPCGQFIVFSWMRLETVLPTPRAAGGLLQDVMQIFRQTSINPLNATMMLALFYIFPIHMGARYVAHSVFCESCQRWCKSRHLRRQSRISDLKVSRTSLENHDFSAIDITTADSGHRCRVVTATCPCGQTNVISVRMWVSHRGTRSRWRGGWKGIVRNLLVSPDEIKAIDSGQTARSPRH